MMLYKISQSLKNLEKVNCFIKPDMGMIIRAGRNKLVPSPSPRCNGSLKPMRQSVWRMFHPTLQGDRIDLFDKTNRT